MKLVTLLAATASAAALAACSHSPGTPAAQPSSGTSGSPSSASTLAGTVHRISCPQRYQAWEKGAGSKAMAAVNAVDSAIAAHDVNAEIAALKVAAPAINNVAGHPIPACADPKGYWSVLLLHINAAANSAESTAGTTSVTVALKGVPQLKRQLTAELKRTAAVK